MRTRKEQIADLSCSIFNQHDNIDECLALARKYIIEAERRAEQRVRAEIGRDSERLDWLDAYGKNNGGVFIPFDPNDSDDFPHPHLRDAIDAAREVGE